MEMPNNSIKYFMSDRVIGVHPDQSMTDVCDIFEKNNFHHLPVLDDKGACVGMISKSDYYQLQDSLTKFDLAISERRNDKLFKTLLASEVMSKTVVSIDVNADVSKAMEVFLNNQVHSIVVLKKGECVGVITPFDILQGVYDHNYLG